MLIVRKVDIGKYASRHIVLREGKGIQDGRFQPREVTADLMLRPGLESEGVG